MKTYVINNFEQALILQLFSSRLANKQSASCHFRLFRSFHKTFQSNFSQTNIFHSNDKNKEKKSNLSSKCSKTDWVPSILLASFGGKVFKVIGAFLKRIYQQRIFPCLFKQRKFINFLWSLRKIIKETWSRSEIKRRLTGVLVTRRKVPEDFKDLQYLQINGRNSQQYRRKFVFFKHPSKYLLLLLNF